MRQYKVGYVYVDSNGVHQLGRCRFNTESILTPERAKDHIEAQTGENVTMIRYYIPCD